MELSLITDDVCDFSGKQEKYLIGLTAKGGKKFKLSSECLQMGMKILQAVQGPDVPNPIPNLWQTNPTPPVAPLTVGPQTPIPNQYEVRTDTPVQQTTTITSATVNASTTQVKPPPKKPAFDMKQAKVFIEALQKNHNDYVNNDENAKKDDGLTQNIMKKTVHQFKNQIDRQVMAKVLKKVTQGKVNDEMFEVIYSTPPITMD